MHSFRCFLFLVLFLFLFRLYLYTVCFSQGAGVWSKELSKWCFFKWKGETLMCLCFESAIWVLHSRNWNMNCLKWCESGACVIHGEQMYSLSERTWSYIVRAENVYERSEKRDSDKHKRNREEESIMRQEKKNLLLLCVIATECSTIECWRWKKKVGL